MFDGGPKFIGYSIGLYFDSAQEVIDHLGGTTVSTANMCYPGLRLLYIMDIGQISELRAGMR